MRPLGLRMAAGLLSGGLCQTLPRLWTAARSRRLRPVLTSRSLVIPRAATAVLARGARRTARLWWCSHAQTKCSLSTRSAPRCGQGPIPVDSALVPLMLVDCRLDRGFRLEAGRLVLGLCVVIAPVAELVGIALEVWVTVPRHQFVAAFRRRPVCPVVRQQQDAAEATIRAFPQSLEMADAIVRGADAGEA